MEFIIFYWVLLIYFKDSKHPSMYPAVIALLFATLKIAEVYR